MKDKSNYIQQVTLLYYYRFKEFITPVIIIITCNLLLITIVIPQFLHILSVQNQAVNENENLQVLQQNFQKVNSINDNQLNSQFRLTVSALPPEKDVISILNTISEAASKANASLQDYNFEAGNIITTGNSLSKVQVSLNLTGNIHTIQQFIHQLKISMPLSNVTAVTTSAGSTNTAAVTVDFYTRPFSNASFDENSPLQLLTPQEEETINTLSSW